MWKSGKFDRVRPWGLFSAAVAWLAACSVDYEANQAEYENRLCDREDTCTGGSSGSGGGQQTAGSGGDGGSSTATGGTAGTGGAPTGGAGGVATGGGGGTFTGGAGGETGGTGGVATGGVGADAGPACTTGAAQCTDDVAEECVDGQWVQTPCTEPAPACEDGACVLCRNGSARCNGETPETCVNHGWQSGAACSADSFCQRGECVTPPSCDGLTSDCGSTANETCCKSLLVPGGNFYRGHEGASPATLSEFLLDRYEVTVGRFRKFVAGYPGNMPTAGDGAHPQIANSGWDPAWNANLPVSQSLLVASLSCSGYTTWTDTPGALETVPMNCLTWYVAFAFCAWDGGRLPTEAEWNYAAAGGNEQRLYPWGDTDPTDLLAAYNCSTGCSVANILPVGSKPDGNGLWGHADLAGNLWEMNLDMFASPYVTPCFDCANLTNGSSRVLRGGAFNSQASDLLTATRNVSVATTGGSDRGFRCARTP